jgi:hypothetical protein
VSPINSESIVERIDKERTDRSIRSDIDQHAARQDAFCLKRLPL